MIAKENLQFLEDLKQNNQRDWFQANKSRYESYKKDYYQLAQDFLDEMKSKDHSLDHVSSFLVQRVCDVLELSVLTFLRRHRDEQAARAFDDF